MVNLNTLKNKEEERGFVQQWLLEDFHTKRIYETLNHMSYVLKAQTSTQAKRRTIKLNSGVRLRFTC